MYLSDFYTLEVLEKSCFDMSTRAHVVLNMIIVMEPLRNSKETLNTQDLRLSALGQSLSFL